MLKSIACALVFAVAGFAADEQLTIHKVTVNTPSGTISGKVVGTGDKLVFIDDSDPSKSFTLTRGDIANYTTESGGIVVQLARPASDQPGTTSNVRITVVDANNSAAITRWISMPVERSRTVTTYSVDVRHDHKGQSNNCTGKLLADDNGLRFESVSNAPHSKSWNYNDLRSFTTEKDNALLKVVPSSGDAYHFQVVNGATVGALHRLVSDKIVAARPASR
jgi:hypothetical protein